MTIVMTTILLYGGCDYHTRGTIRLDSIAVKLSHVRIDRNLLFVMIPLLYEL